MSAGRQIDEARTLIRPVIQHLGHRERAGADSQRSPKFTFNCAMMRASSQTSPRPGTRSVVARNAEGRVGDAHVAAQGIRGRHRIERRQLAQGRR
jgi:hypothetical protein